MRAYPSINRSLTKGQDARKTTDHSAIRERATLLLQSTLR